MRRRFERGAMPPRRWQSGCGPAQAPSPSIIAIVGATDGAVDGHQQPPTVRWPSRLSTEAVAPTREQSGAIRSNHFQSGAIRSDQEVLRSTRRGFSPRLRSSSTEATLRLVTSAWCLMSEATGHSGGAQAGTQATRAGIQAVRGWHLARARVALSSAPLSTVSSGVHVHGCPRGPFLSSPSVYEPPLKCCDGVRVTIGLAIGRHSECEQNGTQNATRLAVTPEPSPFARERGGNPPQSIAYHRIPPHSIIAIYRNLPQSIAFHRIPPHSIIAIYRYPSHSIAFHRISSQFIAIRLVTCAEPSRQSARRRWGAACCQLPRLATASSSISRKSCKMW